MDPTGTVTILGMMEGVPHYGGIMGGEVDIHAPHLLRMFHHQCPGKPGGGSAEPSTMVDELSYVSPCLPEGALVEGAICQAPWARHTRDGEKTAPRGRPTARSRRFNASNVAREAAQLGSSVASKGDLPDGISTPQLKPRDTSSTGDGLAMPL